MGTPGQPVTSAARILVVDDDPDARFVLCGVLSWAGFIVEEAANGLEAVRMMEQRPFAAVVSDYRMPVMDGLELLSIARAAWPETAVIIVSGAISEVIAGASRGGAYACLSKPCDVSRLVTTVRQGIAHASRRSDEPAEPREVLSSPGPPR
jgi:two-component system response regulator HydG